jgi:hypothetical protein
MSYESEIRFMVGRRINRVFSTIVNNLTKFSENSELSMAFPSMLKGEAGFLVLMVQENYNNKNALWNLTPT